MRRTLEEHGYWRRRFPGPRAIARAHDPDGAAWRRRASGHRPRGGAGGRGRPAPPGLGDGERAGPRHPARIAGESAGRRRRWRPARRDCARHMRPPRSACSSATYRPDAPTGRRPCSASTAWTLRGRDPVVTDEDYLALLDPEDRDSTASGATPVAPIRRPRATPTSSASAAPTRASSAGFRAAARSCAMPAAARCSCAARITTSPSAAARRSRWPRARRGSEALPKRCPASCGPPGPTAASIGSARAGTPIRAPRPAPPWAGAGALGCIPTTVIRVAEAWQARGRRQRPGARRRVPPAGGGRRIPLVPGAGRAAARRGRPSGALGRHLHRCRSPAPGGGAARPPRQRVESPGEEQPRRGACPRRPDAAGLRRGGPSARALPRRLSRLGCGARRGARPAHPRALGRGAAHEAGRNRPRPACRRSPGGRTRPSAARVSANGPPVRLAPETALALAMAMHELATNAAKHGALSVPAGRVAVDWRVEPPPERRHRRFGRHAPARMVGAWRAAGLRAADAARVRVAPDRARIAGAARAGRRGVAGVRAAGPPLPHPGAAAAGHRRADELSGRRPRKRASRAPFRNVPYQTPAA